MSEEVWNQKAKNGVWYPIDIYPKININYHDYYVNSRKEFLEKYSYAILSMEVADNFWNSLYGWTYKGVKGERKPLPPFVEHLVEVPLTGRSSEHLVWKNSDSKHNWNEQSEIWLKETWYGPFLDINLILKTMVKWIPGSLIHHSVLLKINRATISLYN